MGLEFNDGELFIGGKFVGKITGGDMVNGLEVRVMDEHQAREAAGQRVVRRIAASNAFAFDLWRWLEVRPMNRADLAKVLELESKAADRGHWNRQRLERHVGRAGACFVVGEVPINGYHWLCAWGTFDTDRTTGRLTIGRIAVAEPARRRKIATELVRRILRRTADADLHTVDAIVRESNTAGCRLLASCGFASKLVRDYYQDPAEDGVRFLFLPARRRIGD